MPVLTTTLITYGILLTMNNQESRQDLMLRALTTEIISVKLELLELKSVLEKLVIELSVEEE